MNNRVYDTIRNSRRKYIVVSLNKYDTGVHMLDDHRKPMTHDDALIVAKMLSRAWPGTTFGIAQVIQALSIEKIHPPVHVEDLRFTPERAEDEGTPTKEGGLGKFAPEHRENYPDPRR